MPLRLMFTLEELKAHILEYKWDFYLTEKHGLCHIELYDMKDDKILVSIIGDNGKRLCYKLVDIMDLNIFYEEG